MFSLGPVSCLKHLPIALTGPNIAFSKSTYQYPGVLGDGKSNKAVDGDTTHSGSVTCTDCAHTDLYNTGATETWWRVDLGDTYRLTGIKIYNRDRRRTLP